MLENASTYAEFASSSMPEWEFFGRLMEDADCGMLLDVNNVYVSSFNHGFDPEAYVDAIDPARVTQYHLAGHTNKGTHIVDTHNDHVIDPVWQLYQRSVRRTGNVSTLLEWDADIPAFDVVHGEALKAARRIRPGGEAPLRPPSPDLGLLPRLQRWMQAVIEQPGTVDDAVLSEAARARARSRRRSSA